MNKSGEGLVGGSREFVVRGLWEGEMGERERAVERGEKVEGGLI